MDVVQIDKQDVPMFCFRVQGSKKVYKLPLLGYLPAKYFRQIKAVIGSDATDAAALEAADVVLDIFDAYCPGLTDTMSLAEMSAISSEWQKASGIGLGE